MKKVMTLKPAEFHPRPKIDSVVITIDFSSHKAHPAILTMKDYDRLMSSSDLFARKFDMTVDGEVLDRIDKVIG